MTIPAGMKKLIWQSRSKAVGAPAVMRWILVVLLALILWAAFTKWMSDARRGPGVLGADPDIQSLDGGSCLKSLLAKARLSNPFGDTLILIDETRAVSSFRENRSQYLSLLAKQSRLLALARDETFSPPEEVLEDVPETYQQELALYNASKEELASQVGIAQSQLVQKERELQEVRATNAQAERGYEFSRKELEVTRPLVASGSG